ncbi:MAG TPA: hypothetical protein PKW17_12935 [Smithellaceae bacterium]|nr:hypothetical protein [Smithellaceae bacterium]HRS90342.1 hypothetical protein [Smithellaceae bacterium]
MSKLNKRQIIILIIAGICVLYAVYEIFIAAPAAKKAKAAANPANINTFVNDLQKDLLKDIASGTDAYIVTKAEDEWEKNPFWDRQGVREWAAKDAAGKAGQSGTIYSGYVDSGKRRLAVINGCEYREGEQLELCRFISWL